MEVRVKDETFVFDVELTNGESEVITLDSGAGVHVRPRGRCEDVPKNEGLRMCAANGTPITTLGRKLINFRGTASGFCPAGVGPRAAHAEDDRAVRPLMPVETRWEQEDQEDGGVSEPNRRWGISCTPRPKMNGLPRTNFGMADGVISCCSHLPF